MKIRLARFGRLDCRLVDSPTSTPELLVVLCHGYGATGSDLVSLAETYVHAQPELKDRALFVFPEAPLALDFAGFGQARAWWHLDLEVLGRAREKGLARVLANESPEGLKLASDLLGETLAALHTHTGLGMAETVLGGFSQGGMLTTHFILASQLAPAHLLVMSGNLLNAAQWRAWVPLHAGCPVFMSHGRQDLVLPFEGATALRDLLAEGPFQVDFHPFHGGHTLAAEGLSTVAQILGQRLTPPARASAAQTVD